MLNFDRSTVKHALQNTQNDRHLTAPECTKFVFGRGSAPDPAGRAYNAPQTHSWFKGALLLRGGKGKGRGEGG